MQLGCMWIDDVEVSLDGDAVRYVSLSEGDRLPSRMSRAVARRTAAKVIRMLDAVDIMEQDRLADLPGGWAVHSSRLPDKPEVVRGDAALGGIDDCR